MKSITNKSRWLLKSPTIENGFVVPEGRRLDEVQGSCVEVMWPSQKTPGHYMVHSSIVGLENPIYEVPESMFDVMIQDGPYIEPIAQPTEQQIDAVNASRNDPNPGMELTLTREIESPPVYTVAFEFGKESMPTAVGTRPMAVMFQGAATSTMAPALPARPNQNHIPPIGRNLYKEVMAVVEQFEITDVKPILNGIIGYIDGRRFQVVKNGNNKVELTAAGNTIVVVNQRDTSREQDVKVTQFLTIVTKS